jgi:hypothetical protein
MTCSGNKRVVAGIAVLVCIAIPAAAQNGQSAPKFIAPANVDTASLRGPRQPIFFRHDIHAGQSQIPCLYCHFSVTVASEPGVPSLQTCVGCHFVVAGTPPTAQAEIKKVRQAWADKAAPQWVRVHTLPAFVHFPHMRHIKALGTESCNTCHGDVRGMVQVRQVAPLTMGWCVKCHQQRQVTRDCVVCHY